MSEHKATIGWKRTSEDFLKGKYSREHRQGFQIDSYDDKAVGTMTKNERQVPCVSPGTLTPRSAYSGAKRPTPAQEEHLHHQAHEQCFIANSIKTEGVVNPIKPGA